jgi:hypothetical protein
MDCCRYVDYSTRPECLTELHNYRCITDKNLRDAKSVIPSGHFWQVELGDRIVAHIIDNRIEGIQGMLSIWHNKGIACLDKGEGKIWGDWLEDEKLLQSHEFEEVLDLQGRTCTGRITYNTHGVRGKFTGGIFYTLFPCVAPINHLEMRGMCHGMP